MFKDITSTLGRVEQQTIKTNGRVGTLERGRSFIQGVVAVMVLLIVPMLSWAIWTLANINQIIHSTVDEALQAYDIDYEDK